MIFRQILLLTCSWYVVSCCSFVFFSFLFYIVSNHLLLLLYYHQTTSQLCPQSGCTVYQIGIKATVTMYSHSAQQRHAFMLRVITHQHTHQHSTFTDKNSQRNHYLMYKQRRENHLFYRVSNSSERLIAINNILRVFFVYH